VRNFLLKRIMIIPLLIFGISIIVFLIVRLVPGDPIALMLSRAYVSDPEKIAEFRAAYGLDQPIYVQYVKWFGKILKGDWGRSILRNEPVLGVLKDKLKNTAILALVSAFLSVIVGVSIGVYSAMLAASERHARLDALFNVGPLLLLVIPQFTMGVILIIVFAVHIPILPPTGMYAVRDGGSFMDLIRHTILPALTLAAQPLAAMSRLSRAAMLDLLREDFVRTARAKGLREQTVLYKHVLRNALIPIVTNVGILVGSLLAGAVMVEAVFSWPGLGKLMVDAILQRDYPMIQGGTLFITLIFVLSNLLVDFSYTLIDPRVRYGSA
jgi:peptide/nickel transport system permease protein